MTPGQKEFIGQLSRHNNRKAMHDEKRCNTAPHLDCGSVQKSWREKHAEVHWFRQTPAHLAALEFQYCSDDLIQS